MVDTGVKVPTNNVLMFGSPITINKNVEVATNVYPGRIMGRGTTDYDMVVANGLIPPIGFVGFGGNYCPETIEDIYTAGKTAPLHKFNGGAGWYIPDGLAVGTVATEGDLLVSWSDGKVVPAAMFDGKIGIKIPFAKSTTLKDTGVKIPAGVIVNGVVLDVTTNASGATIDVGMGAGTESGNDADGLIDGASIAAKGFVTLNTVDATAGNNNLGALLVEADVKSADTTALFYSAPKVPGLVCDGTCVSIDYTTSDHTVAGYMYILVSSPGIVPVGKATATVDASAATAGIWVEV